MVQYVEDIDPADPGVANGAADLVTLDRAPWHLWAVGVVSLLWNGFGAIDYTMSQLRNRDYLGGAASSMGITTDQMIAYIDSFPVWMHGFWALGVWGAVAGSILLLLRKRHAVWAFGLSLLGLAVTQFYQALTPQPEWVQSNIVMNLVIWSIATFLLIYAVSMRNKGVLR